MKQTCILFLFLWSASLGAQNQFKKWYFGDKAGLDFTTAPPTAITGSMNAFEGCSSIADDNANLLFYTDGSTIWNSAHQPMANGSGLTGNSSTTQSSLLVKKPGSSTIYYVFTLGASGNASLNYSEVDMTLAAGLGSVTANKNILVTNNCTEKLTGTRHCNGSDIWVLTRPAAAGVIHAYLVTANGVNLTPVVSSLPGLGNGWSGNMKVSPDGKRLGFAQHQGGMFEICDFDPFTGVASNVFTLLNGLSNPYGIEFSPDGTKLYGATESGSLYLYQWNLCAGNNAAIAASLYSVSVPSQIQGMQIGPDGKIYLAKPSQQSLAIINNPNVMGAGCNYVHNGIALNPGNTSYHNLPNMVISDLRGQITYTVSGCQSPTVAFTAPVINPAFTVSGCSAPGPPIIPIWIFGDPASGPSNTSTASNPVHVYPAAGNYTVKLAMGGSGCGDTLRQVLQFLAPSINITAAPAGTFCSSASNVVTLTANSSANYTWSTGSTAPTLTLSPVQYTTITITATQPGFQCVGSASIGVQVFPTPTLSINGSTTICKGQSLLLDASGATTYSWSNGVLTPTQVVTPIYTTTYYSVIGTNPGGCTSSRIMTVTLHPCTGIAENEAEAALVNVYPNPSMGQVTLENPQAGRLQVYDALGRLLMQEALVPGKHQVDLSRFSNGVLLLRWKDARGEQSMRLLKTDH